MTISPDDVNSWEQLQLFPSPVYEIVMRFGVVPAADHVQWQMEVHDATTGELIKLQSVWHCSIHIAESRLHRVCRLLEDEVRYHLPPFPA